MNRRWTTREMAIVIGVPLAIIAPVLGCIGALDLGGGDTARPGGDVTSESPRVCCTP
jgi:hypothetical protein